MLPALEEALGITLPHNLRSYPARPRTHPRVPRGMSLSLLGREQVSMRMPPVLCLCPLSAPCHVSVLCLCLCPLSLQCCAKRAPACEGEEEGGACAAVKMLMMSVAR
jgi:hypothetical protein